MIVLPMWLMGGIVALIVALAIGYDRAANAEEEGD